MSIHRKLYFLGFAIYIFSFFLPAIPVFNAPVKGYESAFYAIVALFDHNVYSFVIENLLIVAGNLTNLCTIIVFILQFKFTINRLIIFQFIAFISALSFVLYDLIQGNGIEHFLIGYWNWLFGILVMLVVSVRASKATKSKIRISQQASAQGLGG